MKTKCPINEEMVKGVVEDASDDEKVEGENENEGEKNKEKKWVWKMKKNDKKKNKKIVMRKKLMRS